MTDLSDMGEGAVPEGMECCVYCGEDFPPEEMSGDCCFACEGEYFHND